MEIVRVTKRDDTNRKYKVVFFSNSPDLPTGYSKVIREVAGRLSQDPFFDVYVIGEQYSGNEYRHALGFTVLPVHQNSKDFASVCDFWMRKLQADVLVVLEDSFTLANFQFIKLAGRDWKMVFYLPLDGKWVPSTGIHVLRLMNKIVSMAKFTQDCLKNEGFESDMIWHGVDLNLFRPVSIDEKNAIRKTLAIPQDAFVIFNYGRNSLRKDNQRLLEILSDWLVDKDEKHLAICHIMPWNVADLDLREYLDRHIYKKHKKYFFGKQILFLDQGKDGSRETLSDAEVASLIQACDVVVSATTGEGFGLLNAEAMACGKPVITTDYSTARELLIDKYDDFIGERGVVVPYDTEFISGLNTEHVHVNREKFVKEIDALYKDPHRRELLGRNGRLFAEKYLNWDYLVEEWKEVIRRNSR